MGLPKDELEIVDEELAVQSVTTENLIVFGVIAPGATLIVAAGVPVAEGVNASEAVKVTSKPLVLATAEVVGKNL